MKVFDSLDQSRIDTTVSEHQPARCAQVVAVEEGAQPPFGRLYGIRTIMDQALSCDDHILFHAGSHDQAIHMGTEDYLVLAQPETADIAYRPDREE